MDSARLCRPRLQKTRDSWIGRATQQLTDHVSVGIARRRMAMDRGDLHANGWSRKGKY